MRDLKSGAQLASRYTLVRKLGAGGGTETWLASDKLTRASVALKILVDETIPAETLRREWQLSIRLVHAHIARVFEFHDDSADGQNSAFYSMQYIDGPDVSALSGAPLADILAPIGLLADALRYAHEKGVVHRDVKPSNILLDGNGAPYLIDFGVAAAGEDHIGGGSIIASSPQQLDKQTPAASDDIFALGGLIYELVAARSPYSSSSTEDDIRNKIPPPLVAADGSPVSIPVQELVAEMLDKDRPKRPDAAAAGAMLLAAGFEPGPAPAAYVEGVRVVRDEVIKSEASIHRLQRPSSETARTVGGEPGGITPRVLGISLGVLLLVLLGVIFLLPKTITNNDLATADDTSETTSQPQESDSTADNQPLPERDVRVQSREATDDILGRLLSQMRTLEGRAVQRWGGLPFKRAEEAYKAGDAAYLEKDYGLAGDHYLEALDLLEPLLEQVDIVFSTTLGDADQALGNGDTIDALRLYELAVAISPGHGPARRGLVRAKNLDEVISLTEQGLIMERELALDAAQRNFELAIQLDPEWEVAKAGRRRVLQTINDLQFQQRMTEGLTSLSEDDFLAARAAFRMAQELMPDSPEPGDGLMQVDQGIRLGNISALEYEASTREGNEKWQESAHAYSRILELDSDLSFAQDGLTRSKEMIALHDQLDKYIENPDSLSSPRTMQAATQMVVNITRMPDIGPHLAGQRDELSRLLKRAATPLTVQLVSDNVTNVSIYKVGKLGSFSATELSLRPGTYVAVGSRPGYRDVRLEFQVAPEEDMQPIVVRCEERI